MRNKDGITNIRVGGDLLEEIRAVARDEGRSMNGQIRWVMRQYIEQRKAKKEMEAERQRRGAGAQGGAERLEGGVTDEDAEGQAERDGMTWRWIGEKEKPPQAGPTGA